jgi:hypothetical protein
MGVEFLQKSGRTIKVARDKALEELACADLFTRRMALPSTHDFLRLAPGQSVARGENLQIELIGGKVVAVRRDVIVGEIDCPMPGLRELLDEHGIAGGLIDEVYESARVADIEITE